MHILFKELVMSYGEFYIKVYLEMIKEFKNKKEK